MRDASGDPQHPCILMEFRLPVYTLTALPAFEDNYLWVLHDGERALVVDPGDASVVTRFLHQSGLQLDWILVTHHHLDHTGGVAELRAGTGAQVVGPAHEPVPEPLRRVSQGDTVEALGLRFEVLDVPGHTAGHIAYFAPEVDGRPLLFCGDTLFSGGCGRLFEGTPAQMLNSLNRLTRLPGDTRVCCTHEYTLANLKFALAVEPDNTELAQYAQHCQQLRASSLPTLPSSIALEKQINPFLRTHVPGVARAALARQTAPQPDAVGIFATLREWKNNFR